MSPRPLELCPSCQAPHSPEEAFCWMCRRRFWDGSAPQPKPSAPAPVPSPEPPPAAAASAAADSWTQPIMIAAFILILTGLALGKGMGTSLLWLGMLPAFFVTALAGFRAPKKKPETLLEILVWLATKLATAFAIIILAATAITIALMAACFAIFAAAGPHH